MLLVDWSRLKYTVWGGLITAVLQILVDTCGTRLNLYHVESYFKIWGSSPFFTFGVVFTIGVIYAQTLPASRWLQALDILVVVALFVLQEHLFVMNGVLQHLNWSCAASIFIDLLVLTSYTWLVDSLGLNRAGRRGMGGYKL